MIFVRNPKRIKQTKIFLKAMGAGASTIEAKRVSGIPSTLSLGQILETPIAQKLLEEMFKEEDFRDPGLVKRLKEMWNHKKVKAVKVSGPSMIDAVQVEEDDTDMWKYSMDKVLTLRGYLKQGRDADNPSVIEATGGINFNVIQVPNDTEKQKAAA